MIAHADGNGYVCQDMLGQPPEAAIAPVHGHSDHCLDIAGIPSQADILPQSLVDSTVVAVMDGGSISLRGLRLALERQTGVCLVSRRHDIRNMVQRTLQHLGAVTGGCPGECTASSAAKTDISSVLPHGRGRLLFTHMSDEIGLAGAWVGVWEPLPSQQCPAVHEKQLRDNSTRCGGNFMTDALSHCLEISPLRRHGNGTVLLSAGALTCRASSGRIGTDAFPASSCTVTANASLSVCRYVPCCHGGWWYQYGRKECRGRIFHRSGRCSHSGKSLTHLVSWLCGEMPIAVKGWADEICSWSSSSSRATPHRGFEHVALF